MESCRCLFVYGTLRRRCGHPMAKFLSERASCRGEAKARGQLFDLGPYPAAIRSAEADWVFGDLYEIDEATLAALDAYENEESPQPSYFGREISEIVLPDGMQVSAWIYWFHGPLPATALRIPSGQYERVFT